MMQVDVLTGSRLHFGLICGTPESGWVYGGIGMMLRTPGWALRLTQNGDSRSSDAATQDEIVGHQGSEPDAALVVRIRELLSQLSSSMPRSWNLRMELLREIPRHVGFGSGTQLALAVSVGLQTLCGPDVQGNPEAFASRLKRAQRSSIGTIGFERGGFLIDFGKNQPTPSTESTDRFQRIRIPEVWRFLTIRPLDRSGLCGESERQYFDRAATMPLQLVANMDQIIRRGIQPALEQQNFDLFARSLSEYGNLAGTFYSSEQGGIFSDPSIAELATFLARNSIVGTAQSSWGPAVCVPAQNADAAEQLRETITNYATSHHHHWLVEVHRPQNYGATIRIQTPESRQFF